MIILEGPDGAGKTTLSTEICDRFDLNTGTRGTSDRSKLYTVTVQDTFRALKNEVASHKFGPKVWDRLFFSEFVYWKYNKPEPRQCEFNEAQRQFVTELLGCLKVPVVLCLPPVAVVTENAAKAEQMKGVNENLTDIYIDYVNMFRWMPAQTIVYDYTKEDNSRVMSIVEAYLTRRAEREWSRVR